MFAGYRGLIPFDSNLRLGHRRDIYGILEMRPVDRELRESDRLYGGYKGDISINDKRNL